MAPDRGPTQTPNSGDVTMEAEQPRSESSPAISAGEVQIWTIPLDPPAEIVDRLARLVSGEERERADRFRAGPLRDRFLVGRGAMRTILGRCLSEAPERLIFRAGPFGKPGLAGAHGSSGVEFNLSHVKDLAVLAVTLGRRVGVDIEAIRPLPDRDGIVSRFFSDRERSAFATLSEEEKSAAFFRVWTRKEAYIKALGTGLSTPLDRFHVSLERAGRGEVLPFSGLPDDPTLWTMTDLPADPEYVGALVLEGPGWPLRSFRFDPPRDPL
jgi:4'-phosphopantetheinyl transferase